MVVPWLGFPLGALVRRVEPTSRAKYVAFTTLLDPEQMPEQRTRLLDWPYVEGLRIDEAVHPLVVRRVVREVDAERAPRRTQQAGAQATHHTHRCTEPSAHGDRIGVGQQ